MTIFRAPVVNLMRNRGGDSSKKNSPLVSRKSSKAVDENLRHSINDLLSASTSKDGVSGIRYSPMKLNEATILEKSTAVEVVTDDDANEDVNDDDDDDDSPLKLKIRLTEETEDGDGCVYFKDDEDRFSQQYTVKLKTFSEYNVVVEVRPPRGLSYIKVGDRIHTDFIKMEGGDSGKEVYRFLWSTSMIRTTKRKHRSILPFAVKLQQHLEVNFDMFVKFYYSCEEAHYTGTPLSFIELKSGKQEEKEDSSIKDVPSFG